MAFEIEVLEVPVDKVNELLKEVLNLPDTHWVQRREYFQNLGVKDPSDVGHYCSAMDMDLPQKIKDLAEEISIGMSKCELAEVLVNRYLEGDGIPLHQDSQGYLDIIVIPLTDNPGQGFSHIYKGKEIFYEDRLGTAIKMVKLKAYHRVNKIVGDTRYSLVMLFGPKGMRML